MSELIKITEKDGKHLVDARELYNHLEVKQDFSTWIKHRIDKYGFIEGEDFSTILKKSTGGRPLKQYGLTLDMAKELAMVENNEKGRQARRYFIAVEKKAKEQHLKPKSTLEILELTIKGIREQNIQIDEIKADIKELKAHSTTLPEYYTIVGYGSLNNIRVILKDAISLGRKASKICKDAGITMGSVPDPRFGKVKTYPVEILEEVFEASIV